MNVKALRSIALFALLLLFFAACKKNDTAPALSESVVSKDVFHDMFQGLFGDYSVYIGGHRAVPQEFSLAQTDGKRVFYVESSNPLCGAIIDTTISKAADTNADTTLSFGGKLKLTFNCSGDDINDFYTQGDVVLNVTTPELLLSSKVHEDLRTESGFPGNFNTSFTISGTLSSAGTYNYRNGSKNSGTRIFNYKFRDLIIDPVNYEMRQGTIEFTTTGTGAKGSWNYTGVITVTGGNTATVTINGKAYDFVYRNRVIN